jgi:hypothetical protein
MTADARIQTSSHTWRAVVIFAAFPSAIQARANETTINPGLLIVVGLWVAFFGWRPGKPVDGLSAPARESVSVRHGGNSRS